MFVTPKKGLVVRDPQTRKPLPEGGAEVPTTPYWLRRVRDGDVVEVAPPRESATPKPPPPPEIPSLEGDGVDDEKAKKKPAKKKGDT